MGVDTGPEIYRKHGTLPGPASGRNGSSLEFIRNFLPFCRRKQLLQVKWKLHRKL